MLLRADGRVTVMRFHFFAVVHIVSAVASGRSHSIPDECLMTNEEKGDWMESMTG
jgi:hypothetical protein